MQAADFSVGWSGNVDSFIGNGCLTLNGFYPWACLWNSGEGAWDLYS